MENQASSKQMIRPAQSSQLILSILGNLGLVSMLALLIVSAYFDT